MVVDKSGLELLSKLATLKRKRKLDDVVCLDLKGFRIHLKPNSVFFPKTDKDDVIVTPTLVMPYTYKKEVHKGFLTYECLADSRFFINKELKLGMDMPNDIENVLSDVLHSVREKSLKGVTWIGMGNTKNRMWVLYNGKEFENDSSVFAKSKGECATEYVKVTRMKGFDLFRPATAKEYANSLANER